MKITDKVMRALKPPADEYTILWDDEVTGFGARITCAGVVSFVLSYRAHGTRKRVYTIGRFPEWTALAARDEAIDLKKKIRNGGDPAGERQAVRHEATFGDLLDDYLKSEEFTRKRPHTQRDYRRMAEKHLRPAWGMMRLKTVQRRDVEVLHTSLKDTPYQANRIVSFASRLFNYAIEEKMTEVHPARNIEHFHEEKRTRFLNEDDSGEIARFTAALDAYRDQNAANALRLLLLTGSRSGEVLKADWSQFNLTRGIWTKPSSHTKQKKTEHVPLSPEALALLKSMKSQNASGPLFLGRAGKNGKRKARVSLKRPWLQCCKAAGLVEVYEVHGKRGKLKRYKPVIRTHDLRHTFASHLVSNGVGLPVVGKLLGHVTPSITQRYAHLSNDSLKEATAKFGKILEFERKRA